MPIRVQLWRSTRALAALLGAALVAPCAFSAPAADGSLLRLADFEQGFPVARGGKPGFLPQNQRMAAVLSGGARGTGKYARLFLTTADWSVYVQHALRRRYLTTGTSLYEPGGANALRFWLRVRPGSHLLCDEPASRFGVWTYHWRSDDPWVGGPNGTSATTDSMMHGYANFCLTPEGADRWVPIELSESAFKQQRDYYHFYAARGVTGDLEFFPALRQVQFVLVRGDDRVHEVDLDEIELVRRPPTASFDREFVPLRARASGGDVTVPVILRNPTDRARRYRVFVSSFLGAPRELLNRVFGESDDIHAITAVQKAVGGDGGVGVAELVSEAREAVTAAGSEIQVSAGGEWRGALVHRVRPEMLGRPATVTRQGRSWTARRNTLTTSVLAWDPDESAAEGMKYVRVPPSNADDGRHPAPPGFPGQERPPAGWRSEDVPIDQVGGYLVTEIVLE